MNRFVIIIALSCVSVICAVAGNVMAATVVSAAAGAAHVNVSHTSISAAVVNVANNRADSPASEETVDWPLFMGRHDMLWDTITADPVEPTYDAPLRCGYYAGAIMGNGRLGTNLYKLSDGVYRLNAGRSDVTEARRPYSLFNSARLPIGYFTLSTVGRVADESMRLSLYDATTTGRLTTDRGAIDFATYVHATRDCIIFETEAQGDEADFVWGFTPQQAVSPRHVLNRNAPAGYVNCEGKSNPDPVREHVDGVELLIQPLAADTTFSRINRYYVVGWRETGVGNRRRIAATIAQADDRVAAVREAVDEVNGALSVPSTELADTHSSWWHDFYRRAAFVTFADPQIESFYWAQYYKFASTARRDCPVVDLQGVWPTWDTPWPAIWVNLNIQLTYSWLVKANLGELGLPLWDALYDNRDNLRRNVTDIPGQESWTDAAVLPRTATYDFHAPLDPSLAESNQYEVGNLTWTLFYYRQHCDAYNDTARLTGRLFPLLKSAVNTFFRIRREGTDGLWHLPPTASPEYTSGNPGPDTNYDLANLRWGLNTLIDIDTTYHIGDPMLGRWIDFRDRLADYPFSPTTGFKVSATTEFTDTTHRHYSHLFMLYPYHLLDWDNPADSARLALSLDRWNGNQGYSRTGKASMLLSRGDGEGALAQMRLFMQRFVKPNTLYAETGPVIETPLAAVSTLHDFYLQDWGDCLRVFYGMPAEWADGAFDRLRASGAFVVSATRRAGHTVYIRVMSEAGGPCRVLTDIPVADLCVADASGNALDYTVTGRGVVEIATAPGDVIVMTDKTKKAELPSPVGHPEASANPFGDGSRQRR